MVFQSGENYAIRDGFPVSELHTLIIPKRHVQSYFDLSEAEISSLQKDLHQVRTELLKEDVSISGFNVGFNDGIDAGQTVMHCHVHLIPRRRGDVEDPRGGCEGSDTWETKVPTKQGLITNDWIGGPIGNL